MHALFLAAQLHVLRPTLLLPPLALLGTVLSSDIANAKVLTGIFSGLGVSSSYFVTLPQRVLAEKRAFEARTMWAVTWLLARQHVVSAILAASRARALCNPRGVARARAAIPAASRAHALQAPRRRARARAAVPAASRAHALRSPQTPNPKPQTAPTALPARTPHTSRTPHTATAARVERPSCAFWG